ncbi:protein phosphatase-like protein PP1 regulatory subunit sds22 [Xylogone sp. PMI_703]|nr:protein phosphatase-like protein PP1 regulatory subunit sds22 [Xylogone sp. PMI_703]
MSEEEKQHTSAHISIDAEENGGSLKGGPPRSTTGWDGKLRMDKKLELANPEALSDPEYSDEDNVIPGELIDADEDLLDDYPVDTEEIDCSHSRISSIGLLKLERFKSVMRLCLRQNIITEIEGLSVLASTLEDLDLYDNLISHIRGLEELTNLKSLDLSFNKIKHIKRVDHLTGLTDLYFVQNKIGTIDGLAGLHNLRNLELAANRIREIQNLETLEGLEELWLGKNKITHISGLETLKKLKILSIQSNRIREITGLDGLENLEELYISHNAITSLSGLDNVPKLRVLDISSNQIPSLQGLKHLEQLEEVWASYNQINDFAEVESELADKKNLTTVYFEGNPLQLKSPALYRNKVRLALPQVIQIDATFVRAS